MSCWNVTKLSMHFVIKNTYSSMCSHCVLNSLISKQMRMIKLYVIWHYFMSLKWPFIAFLKSSDFRPDLYISLMSIWHYFVSLIWLFIIFLKPSDFRPDLYISLMSKLKTLKVWKWIAILCMCVWWIVDVCDDVFIVFWSVKILE